MTDTHPRHLGEPGPYKDADWSDTRCESCGQGGLFLGDSRVCVKCEDERDSCTACGKRPRAADLLCAECQAIPEWAWNGWEPGDLV